MPDGGFTGFRAPEVPVVEQPVHRSVEGRRALRTLGALVPLAVPLLMGLLVLVLF